MANKYGRKSKRLAEGSNSGSNSARGRDFEAHSSRTSRIDDSQYLEEGSENASDSGEFNANLAETFGRSKRSGLRSGYQSGSKSSAPAPSANKNIRAYLSSHVTDEHSAKWLHLPEIPRMSELHSDNISASVCAKDLENESTERHSASASDEQWNAEVVLTKQAFWNTQNHVPSWDHGDIALPSVNLITDESHWDNENSSSQLIDVNTDPWGDESSCGDATSWRNPDPSTDRLEESQESPNEAGFTNKSVNYVEGPWPSKDVYLRNHYKLLREDSIRPLRDTVQLFLSMPDMYEDRTRPGIGIYEQTRTCGITFSPRGLGFRMTFSLKRTGKKIKWEQSKRLITGSLVVLISSNTPVKCRVATVAARPLSGVQKSPPEIDLFFHDAADVDLDCSTEWTMLENRSGYFEAARHTMVALQRMIQERFPLANNLINVSTAVDAPRYVTNQPKRNLNSLCVNSSGPSSFTNVLEAWPANLQTSLDGSQKEAVQRILSKEVSIIQGPPGTGKTFVSVQALKCLLENTSRRDPPIIIACQTNHALDQLLRHVANFEDEFARIGGQSQDPHIKEHTVYNLRETERHVPPYKTPPAWKTLLKNMQDIVQPLSGNDDVLSTGMLLKYEVLTQAQVESLDDDSDDWATAGETCESVGSIRSWAGPYIVPSKSMAPDDYGYEHSDDSDEEFEEILETEAEQITRDEEDEIERLNGDYIEIKDICTGKVIRPIRRSVLESRLKKESNLGNIKINERGQYYRHFVTKLKEAITGEIRSLFSEYQDAVRARQIRRFEIDEMILRRKRVIALTTTGLAKYRALVASLEPKVLMIEEAAETLEAPIIAGCVQSLEHLILVGDHQQLRPHCHVKEFERSPYNMHISMFERLIDNGVEFTRLALQRRMRPSISKLLMPIYGTGVQDHDSVKDLPDVPGMEPSCYFFTHDFLEAKDQNLSTFNIREAEMIVGFVRYLLLNSVPPEKITIITFYHGQRKKLILLLRKDSTIREGVNIQVKTVDSYQGEENDIVILSLVRSNNDNSIGFLSVKNRVCVAISRARRGFYMFGNAELLCQGSEVWSEITKHLVEPPGPCQLGNYLPVKCQRHGRTITIQEPEDWRYNAGGCDQPCDGTPECDEPCLRLCHP